MVVTGQMGTAGAIPFVTWKLVDVRTGNSLGGGSVDGQELRLLADKIIAEVLPLVAKENLRVAQQDGAAEICVVCGD